MYFFFIFFYFGILAFDLYKIGIGIGGVQRRCEAAPPMGEYVRNYHH